MQAAQANKGITDDPHEVFDSRSTPLSGGWWTGACSTAGSPWPHGLTFALGIVGMGKGAAAVLPGFQPSRNHGGSLVP